MRRLIFAWLVVAGALGASAIDDAQQQPPPRDSPTSQPTGAAVIAGTLVTTDTPQKPIRRGRVTINGIDRPYTKAVTTDDSGRFSFRALPAGRYSLQAAKPAWITTAYGAKRPGRPGTPLVLAEGQHLTGLSITMPRGAVVTGSVHYQDGQPAPGVSVIVTRSTIQNGQWLLSPAGGVSQVVTDDRGDYRAFGILPGEIVVFATVQGVGRFITTELRQMGPGEVERAIQASRQRAGGAAGTGMPPPTAPVTVDYGPIFYPGTSDPASAIVSTLAAGEELTGMDLVLSLVRTSRIEGTVTTPDGIAPSGTTVLLVSGGPVFGSGIGLNGLSRAATDKDGKYRLAGVSPGVYTLAAAASVKAPAAGPAGSVELSAQSQVVVNGQNLNIPLSLQPSMTLSGRVVFDGGPPPAEANLNVNGRGFGGLAPVLAQALQSKVVSGAFSFPGVMVAGKYQLTVRGLPPGKWFVKSSIARGQESLDAPIEIGPGESITDWVITYTDHPSELAGTLQDTTGRGAPDYFIIAFPTNKALWTPSSWRIMQTRPGADGKFSIKGLPTGDYFVAALTDVEPGEWFSPAFLDQIVGSSLKVKLTEGQKTVQDLKLAGGV